MDSAKPGTQPGSAASASYMGKWLIKSSGRILGPFQHERIAQLILSQEVATHDEVAKVAGRWKVIREEIQFMQAVEQLNRQRVQNLDETGGTISQTFSDSLEQTQTILEERDPALSLDEQKAQAQTAKQYSQSAPTVAFLEARNRQLRLMIFAGLILIAAVITVVELQRPPSTMNGNSSVGGANSNLSQSSSLNSNQEAVDQKLLKQAMNALHSGEQEQALKLLQEAHAVNPKNIDVRMQLAPLLLKFESQTSNAKRLLQESLSMSRANEHVKLGSTGLALAALIDNDFSNAEIFLKEALKVDPKFAPALFNLGMLGFLQRKFEQAEKTFIEISSLDATNVAAELMAIRSVFSQRKTSGTAKDYQDLEKRVRNLMIEHSDFRDEAGLLALQIVSAREKSEQRTTDLKNLMNELLQQDPLAGDLHAHDPLLFLQPMSWSSSLSSYAELVQEFASGSDESLQAKALHSLSVFKAGRKQEARQILDDVLAKKPERADYLSLKAAMLISLGQTAEAKSLLKRAVGSDSGLIAQVLLLHVCPATAGSQACPEIDQVKLTKGLQSDEVVPIALIVWSASQAWAERRTADALALMARARKMAPNYGPLLQMDITIAQGGGG